VKEAVAAELNDARPDKYSLRPARFHIPTALKRYGQFRVRNRTASSRQAVQKLAKTAISGQRVISATSFPPYDGGTRRRRRGEDHVPTAYPPEAIDAWAARLRSWASGHAPDDLPRVAPSKPAATVRDVFAYVIHEGKVRAPAGAMALIERLSK
jgi:uncharacterized protein YecE (DUF72 family)